MTTDPTACVVPIPPGVPGETLVTIHIDGTDPCFPALIDDQRWNGWACPRFRPEVAAAVLTWANAAYDRHPDDGIVALWDGDAIVLIDTTYVADRAYLPERIVADSDGRYPIGACGWCWETREGLDSPETA